MNITKLRLEIKSLWRRYTDYGPRLHLRSPLAIKPSRAQCEAGFYQALLRAACRQEKVEGYTNTQLASKLEAAAADRIPAFSVLDSLVDEAVLRLRGPGTPATAEVAPPDDPVLATRRSEP